MAPSQRHEIETIVRLACARYDGILTPYPGDYSGRTLDLVDIMVNAIAAVRRAEYEEDKAR